tara:strand:+ start:296 stop:472 length:177 start_codon:yes stop_codon:yes gene_type:complete
MEQTEGFQERIIYVDSDTAKCSGDNYDHPLTYYKVPETGFVVCGYCDIKFVRKQAEDD